MSDLQQPLLSICIPTYNRSQYLKKTLDSIIVQEGFKTENVEIVISDNCSTDDTELLCKEYVDCYSNIKYYRNEENIADRNFARALSKGKGSLLKLCNDTLLFNEGSLDKLLQLVCDYSNEKPVLFITNKGSSPYIEYYDNLESFLYQVSFNITWIGGLCIWRDDFEQFRNNSDGCDKKLWQVPVLLQYLSVREKSLIINTKLFEIQSVQGKNISYGLFKVFYENYLSFIRLYLEKNLISKDCFDWLEKDLLFNFFPNWMIQYTLKNNQLQYSDTENLVSLVKNAYCKKNYYIKFKRMYNLMLVKAYIKKILKKD